MEPPLQPVTLTLMQVEELSRKLSEMRHNINNCLAVITATVEIANRKPEAGLRLMNNLTDLPSRVSEEMQKFSADWDRVCRMPPA